MPENISQDPVDDFKTLNGVQKLKRFCINFIFFILPL